VDYVKSAARLLGVDLGDLAKRDLHIHFPAGAIPKDGPSAGITIATALLSLLHGRAVPGRLAMTGELTLTGEVLPVGGVREKVLAARRRGIREVVLPEGNRKEIGEIRRDMVEGLGLLFVRSFPEVHRAVFGARQGRGRRA